MHIDAVQVEVVADVVGGYVLDVLGNVLLIGGRTQLVHRLLGCVLGYGGIVGIEVQVGELTGEELADFFIDASIVWEVQCRGLVAYINTPYSRMVLEGSSRLFVGREGVLLAQLSGIGAVAAPPARHHTIDNGSYMVFVKQIQKPLIIGNRCHKINTTASDVPNVLFCPCVGLQYVRPYVQA